MKKMIIMVCLTFTLFGCTTIGKNNKSNNDNENISLMNFNSHPINITLKENKTILNQLNKDLITLSEYDSTLTKMGRVPTKSIFIENSICSTENEESFRKAMKAMFFFEADSLLQIVKSQMKYLTEIDSTYILPYLILSYDYYCNDKLEETIKLLEKVQTIPTDFDKSEISIFKAEIFQELGDFDKAIQEYEKAFSQNKNLIENNWESLFYLYKELKMYKEAEKLFYDAEKLSSNSQFKINNVDSIISIFLKQKKYDEIINIYNSITDMDESISFEKEYIIISLLNGNFSIAKQKLVDMIFVNIDYDATPILNIPYIDSTDIINKELTKTIENLTSNIPDELLCYGLITLSFEINKDFGEEKNSENLRKGLAFLRKSKINDSQIYYIMGYIYQLLNEKSESIQYFSKVETLSNYYPYALINKAHILENDIQLSLDYFIKASKLLPNNSFLSKKIADLYFYKLEDYINAINWYQIVIDKEPNNNIALIELSESFLGINKTQDALKTINSAIDNLYLNEDSWTRNWLLSLALEVKGNILKNLNHFDDAKLNYLNSLKFNPDNMDVKLAIADLSYEFDDYTLAEKMYLSVIDSITVKTSIKYYVNYYYRALSGLNLHYTFYEPNPIKRIKLFEQAINFLPSDDWCYRNLGSAYSDQKEFFKAKNSFNKAIELNPNDYLNYSFFAYTLKEQRKYNEAIQNYNKSIDVIRSTISADDNLSKDSSSRIIGNFYATIAEIYLELLDYDKSIMSYKNAIAAYPDTTGIKFKFDLASVYFDKKDYVNAIKNWYSVFNNNNDLFSLCKIGLSYFKMGEKENLINAVNCFEKVIILGKNKEEYEDLIYKSEESVKIINEQINRIEWPNLIIKNVNSNNQLISFISQLYQLTDDYSDLNDLFIDGVKDTTPNKEYLEYSKEWIVTSYNVSPKIFQSESLCDRFKSKILLIESINSQVEEIKSLWSSAAEIRREGISTYSKGLYVKLKDYSGEYERGQAKIDVANQYYADGLKILKSLMQKEIEHFSNYGIETIDDMIKYYEHKE